MVDENMVSEGSEEVREAHNELPIEQVVENIEKYGNQWGEEGKPPEREAKAEEETTEKVADGFSFKSMDDLLAHKLKYQASGKDVEEDLATILKRASFGYNSAQLNAEAKRLQQEAEERIKNASQMEEKWSKFDSYAQENPEWYAHWQRAWENRTLNPETAGFDPAEQANVEARVEQLLKEKLAPYEDKFQTLEQREQEEKFKQEDLQLEQEVNGIREKYKDIDFDHSDPETGESLEYQVLKFQAENGIKSFETAFKAFYHDKLVAREVEKAEQAKLKAEQESRRQGVVGVKSKEANGLPNLRGLTDEQIIQMQLEELKSASQ